TVTGLSGPNTFPALLDTGTTLTITGSGFVTPGSPLFGATTVPQTPSQLFPTKTLVVDGLETLATVTVGVAAQNLIHATPVVGDQAGAFRPKLGLKTLEVLTPPCVSANPALPSADARTILVQDALGPSVTSLFPNVVTSPGPGPEPPVVIEIHGGNFFARRPLGSLPTSQSYALPDGSVPTPQLPDGQGPAVSFRGSFSPCVVLALVL